MTRYARRVDANHGEIRDGLRKFGYVVADLSGIGHGIPDLRVLIDPEPRPMLTLYIEVKDGKKSAGEQALTEAESDWFLHNPNSVVVNSLDAAIVAIEKFKSERLR